MPKPSDLSYYNWETQHSTSNSTPNFQVLSCSQEYKKGKERRRNAEGKLWRGGDERRVAKLYQQVIADNEAGLLFKNKRDRKVTC